MSRNKKPRKAYRPRPVTGETMALALHYAAAPSAADHADVFNTLGGHVKALREGVATDSDWAVAAGMVEAAIAIEDKGIVRGIKAELLEANDALQAIYARATHTGRWLRATLYAHEIQALTVFVNLFGWQLSHLGRAEILAAIALAHGRAVARGQKVTIVRAKEKVEA